MAIFTKESIRSAKQLQMSPEEFLHTCRGQVPGGGDLVSEDGDSAANRWGILRIYPLVNVDIIMENQYV